MAELPAVLVVLVAFTLFFSAIPTVFILREAREDTRLLFREAEWAITALLTDPNFLATDPNGPGVFDLGRVQAYAGDGGWELLEDDLARRHHMRVMIRDHSDYASSQDALVLDLRSWEARDPPRGAAASQSAPVALVAGDREVHAARLVVTLWEAELA